MTVVVPSCSFLDEFPTTNLVDKQIYENLESANSALEGCYQSLLGLYGSHFLNHIQGGSVLQYNHSGQQDSWFNHTLYSSHASNANVYKNVYSAISKCNSFIDCASASELPEEWVKESIAQARFVRAYTYFFATRIWGDLPLILDKVVSLSQAEICRNGYQDIYKAILDDLSYAEANLKTREQQTTDEILKGHVCNYAATALKAKVYVQIAS